MDKHEINKGLVMLFEAKGMRDYNNTIDVWIGLCEHYKLLEIDIIKAVDQLITEQTPYRLEFAHLLDKIRPKVSNEIIETQWQKITKKSSGRKIDVDPLAEKCFLMITSYDAYGYEGSDWVKGDWHKRWCELYTEKLETENNIPMIDIEYKKLQEKK